MLKACNVGVTLTQLSASPSRTSSSLPCLRDVHLYFYYVFLSREMGLALQPDVFWHLETCKPHPTEQLCSGFCLGCSRGRQPQAASDFRASCLRREAPRCVPVTLLQLVQCSFRKTRGEKTQKGLNCCCLSCLFSDHFMRLQTQPTLTRVH